MGRRITSLAQLNQHNARRAKRDRTTMAQYLGNREIAIRAEMGISESQAAGRFSDQNGPLSLMEIYEAAAKSLGPDRGRFANQHNAEKQKAHRIGHLIVPRKESGCPPYRVQRTVQDFGIEFIKAHPQFLAQQSFDLFRNALKTIADNGSVREVLTTKAEGNHPLRRNAFVFSVEGTRYTVSFGSFERWYTEAHRQEVVPQT